MTRENWQRFGLLAVAVIIFRLAGFIGSIWMGFGIIALFATLFIISQFPVNRRLVRGLFLIWIAIMFGTPLLGYIPGMPNNIREAFHKRGVSATLRMSENIAPEATEARATLQQQCDRIEAEATSRWQLKLKNATPDTDMSPLYAELGHIKTERRKCEENISEPLGPQLKSAAEAVDGLDSRYIAIGIGAVLFVAFLLLLFIRGASTALTVAIVVGLFYGASLVSNEAGIGSKPSAIDTTPTPEEWAKIAKNTPHGEEVEYPFTVDSVREVGPFQIAGWGDGYWYVIPLTAGVRLWDDGKLVWDYKDPFPSPNIPPSTSVSFIAKPGILYKLRMQRK